LCRAAAFNTVAAEHYAHCLVANQLVNAVSAHARGPRQTFRLMRSGRPTTYVSPSPPLNILASRTTLTPSQHTAHSLCLFHVPPCPPRRCVLTTTFTSPTLKADYYDGAAPSPATINYQLAAHNIADEQCGNWFVGSVVRPCVRPTRLSHQPVCRHGVVAVDA